MPSARVTYDPEMRHSEHGSRLYAYWRKIYLKTEDPHFQEFPKFYNWAMANGYTVGAKLFRYDADEPHSRDNCFWVPRSEWVGKEAEPVRNLAWEQKWDETVNRIREHFGMKPIYSSEV